jgi:zinc protease
VKPRRAHIQNSGYPNLIAFLIGVVSVSLMAVPDPAVGAALAVKRTVLKNGMVLLVSPQPTLPIVNIQMIFRAGALRDPLGKEGLGHLVADLLDEGTATRNSSQIADEIDFVGGSLGTGGGGDWASASLRILKKDLHLGLELLSDVILHPSFPEEELSRVRDETLAGLTAEKDDPGVVATRAFDKLVFGTHPYHRPEQGTEESLPGIRRDDLMGFHDRYYRPNNTIVAVVGDITEAEAELLVGRYFGSWEAREVPGLDITPPSPIEKKVVELIDKDLTQATILLGHVGIDRMNPDYYPVLVMNYILGGGGFSSRLLKEIRDNQGLAYSIHSRFDTGFHPGSFAASLQTKNESAQRAIDGVIAEIRRIRDEPVSKTELEQAKSFLIGSFPLRMETTGRIAGLLAQIEFFGLGLDYFNEYTEKIRMVTREDIQRVARKYLSTEKFVLVVVANLNLAKVTAVQSKTMEKR